MCERPFVNVPLGRAPPLSVTPGLDGPGARVSIPRYPGGGGGRRLGEGGRKGDRRQDALAVSEERERDREGERELN